MKSIVVSMRKAATPVHDRLERVMVVVVMVVVEDVIRLDRLDHRSSPRSSRSSQALEPPRFTWEAEAEGPWEEDPGMEGIERRSHRRKALCRDRLG